MISLGLTGVVLLSRIAGVCGIVSQLAGFVILFLVISTSPWFRWTEDDISVLGIESPRKMLFNYGLILVGGLSLLFAVGLGQSFLLGRIWWFGIASLMLGSLAVSAVGVFPRNFDLPHDLSTLAFFVFTALAFLLIGVAAVSSSQMIFGVPSIVAGALIVIFQLVPWPWSGGAIPQLLSCLPWSLWTIAMGVRLLMSPVAISV